MADQLPCCPHHHLAQKPTSQTSWQRQPWQRSIRRTRNDNAYSLSRMRLVPEAAYISALPSIWWGTDPSTPRSEEHTSELQSLMRISYAVFCLKKKITHKSQPPQHP